ncbi:hypothetical protein D3C87_1556070 [compost metagenome]
MHGQIIPVPGNPYTQLAQNRDATLNVTGTQHIVHRTLAFGDSVQDNGPLGDGFVSRNRIEFEGAHLPLRLNLQITFGRQADPVSDQSQF